MGTLYYLCSFSVNKKLFWNEIESKMLKGKIVNPEFYI